MYKEVNEWMTKLLNGKILENISLQPAILLFIYSMIHWIFVNFFGRWGVNGWINKRVNEERTIDHGMNPRIWV